MKQTFSQAATYLTTGWRRKLLTLCFILLTVAVIGQILYVNRETLGIYLREARPIFLLPAALFFVLDLLLALYAWHLLVSNLTAFDNFRINTKINLYSNLARRIPGSVWYVASRAILYEEQGVSKKMTTLLSALELTFFISSGIVVTLCTLPFWELPSNLSNDFPTAWLIIFIALCSLLLANPTILQFIWRWLAKESVRQLYWRETLYWLLIYALTWVVGGFVLHAVINLFQPLALTVLPMSIGVWSLAGIVSLVGFISLSVFGLREVSLALLLTPILPLPVTLLIGIVVRLIWLSGELISSLYSLRL